MSTGTVKFFNTEKGFGFIKSNETGEDIFVHITGVQGTIRENDNVTFDTENGKKGLTAVNVKVA
ncbi:MAG: cold-shock protein [Bacteroidetes bacterium B1(2017)]|nr:MAG: cold-shock protein [Bacteroidetes bacterium B1(2017)]